MTATPLAAAPATMAPPSPASHVIKEDPISANQFGHSVGNLIINVASAGDAIGQWSPNPMLRDGLLRAFWPTETYFASGLFTVASQYVSFGYSLRGPKRMVDICQRMLNNVQMGKGWQGLMMPLLIDYLTQDNGAFIEVVRADNNDPKSPVVSLNHLDSRRCYRTGLHETPVVYQDILSNFHKLKWWQVITLCEMPSPQEEAHGAGYCALTRVLRGAQIMRDIQTVQSEKAGGRFTRQVHLVSGVQTRIIEDTIAQKQNAADAAGLVRYIQPIIIASLDPTSRVSKETIDLASVPEEWDPEKSLQAYLTLLSMAFGVDYQNFAPLPGAGLGSASQSKVLNMKQRGKGPGLFMSNIETIFNFHGIFPATVTLHFGEQDAAQEMERIELKKARALTREIQIRSGVITTEVARQMMLDDGDLDEHYLHMMRERNTNEDITQASTVPVHDDPANVRPGMPGPKEPPGGKPPNPSNNNEEQTGSPASSQRRNPGGPKGS